MLIKSVIKADCRRFIVVILHLTGIQGKNDISDLQLAYYIVIFEFRGETGPQRAEPKKISYEQKQTHPDNWFSINFHDPDLLAGSIYGQGDWL